MENKKEHINPNGLFKNPAFSQVVSTQGNGKTIYIGGQNGVDKKAEIVGRNDIASQTEQALKNLKIALKSSEADYGNLVKPNIYIVQGQDLRKSFEASRKLLANISKQPIVTVLFVAGLANPDYLIEIDAIAFIPEKTKE
ncbi:MAG: RidA family protein [Bacteroidota bacterium]